MYTSGGYPPTWKKNLLNKMRLIMKSSINDVKYKYNDSYKNMISTQMTYNSRSNSLTGRQRLDQTI